MAYTFGAVVEGTMEDVEERVTELLAEQGFGVLTRIDVQATLKQKIGVDRAPYVILGACNPEIAHGALTLDEDLGALLPCNVIVRKDGESIAVIMMDPIALLGIVDTPEIEATSHLVRAKLERVIEGLNDR